MKLLIFFKDKFYYNEKSKINVTLMGEHFEKLRLFMEFICNREITLCNLLVTFEFGGS